MPVDPISSLFFNAFGPETARTIVFLHGGGSGAWMWQPVIDRLGSYRCIAPDLPEHGQSRAVAPFTMESAADRVADLIGAQALGGRAVVAGLSEGAQVLVALLSRHPEVVEQAFISSALLRPLPGAALMTRPVLAWSYRVSIPPFRSADWWIKLNMKYAAGIPEEYYAQFKKDFQETTESGFVNLMLANQSFRLPSNLSGARCPALVVVGQKEYGAMKQSARDLAAALPGARAFALDLGNGASLAAEHNWALTAPDLFAQTLHAFIDRGPLPQALQPL